MHTCNLLSSNSLFVPLIGATKLSGNIPIKFVRIFLPLHQPSSGRLRSNT
ncbi:unnamed protein product [Schistosoma margrebowiei]|uniref:Uncharacterized protein n=1 Tax=Schistosoma margrebowiei TaxID=48269 RepID=A0A183MZU6_9TREM|nr:unnamed protein product [Schistosoma margrebowiei]